MYKEIVKKMKANVINPAISTEDGVVFQCRSEEFSEVMDILEKSTSTANAINTLENKEIPFRIYLQYNHSVINYWGREYERMDSNWGFNRLKEQVFHIICGKDMCFDTLEQAKEYIDSVRAE